MTVDESAARTQRRKDLSIQTLRGVACILVVAYHVRGAGPTQGLRLPKTDAWSRVIDSLVYVRMPLFSFLSGYVYALRPLRSGYPTFVRGKARRLLIPLLFVGTLFAIAQSISPGTNSSVADEIPWYQWHIIPIRHLWFLESIFWVFAVIGIADIFRRLETVRVIIAVDVVAIAADTVIPVGNDLFGVRLALYLLPFFLTGLACYRFDWRGAGRQYKVVVVAALVPLILITQLGVWGAIDEVPSRHSPIAAALGLCACLALLLTRLTWRPLVYIGGFSFTIYMVHPLGSAGMRHFLDKAGVDSVTINMVVGIAAGIVLGIVVELIARRFRITRLLVLGQRYERRRPAVSSRRTPSGPGNLDQTGTTQAAPANPQAIPTASSSIAPAARSTETA